MLLQEKFELLKENIKKRGSAAVAFSGGVGSTFLVRVAHEVLGDVHVMDKIGKKFKKIGFLYVTLDMLGYRTGSMNEVLSAEEKTV